MFPNLRAEMARKGLTAKKTAAGAGMEEKTFSNKMTGRYPFNLHEMQSIRNAFFRDLTLDYLFEMSPVKKKKNKAS